MMEFLGDQDWESKLSKAIDLKVLPTFLGGEVDIPVETVKKYRNELTFEQQWELLNPGPWNDP